MHKQFTNELILWYYFDFKTLRANIDLFSALFICQDAFPLSTSNIYILIHILDLSTRNFIKKTRKFIYSNLAAIKHVKKLFGNLNTATADNYRSIYKPKSSIKPEYDNHIQHGGGAPRFCRLPRHAIITHDYPRSLPGLRSWKVVVPRPAINFKLEPSERPKSTTFVAKNRASGGPCPTWESVKKFPIRHIEYSTYHIFFREYICRWQVGHMV